MKPLGNFGLTVVVIILVGFVAFGVIPVSAGPDINTADDVKLCYKANIAGKIAVVGTGSPCPSGYTAFIVVDSVGGGDDANDVVDVDVNVPQAIGGGSGGADVFATGATWMPLFQGNVAATYDEVASSLQIGGALHSLRVTLDNSPEDGTDTQGFNFAIFFSSIPSESFVLNTGVSCNATENELECSSSDAGEEDNCYDLEANYYIALRSVDTFGTPANDVSVNWTAVFVPGKTCADLGF